MRARDPDISGFAERDGIKIGYEVFGEGQPAVVFTPNRRNSQLPVLESPGALPGQAIEGRHH